MKIIDIKSKNSLSVAAVTLRQPGILIFPTDTVYGIGCLRDEKAIKRLYKIKNRPYSQPTALLLTLKIYTKIRSSMIWYRSIPAKMERDFFDGQITIVFPISMFKMKFPQMITNDNKIGIRLPRSPWLERLIEMVGPIVASSANKKGQPAPAKFSEIESTIIGQADLTIKTDKILPGFPSRVYDLERKEYLR